jgi:hypothetical protein
VNDWSATQVNSIRQRDVASLLAKGEAQSRRGDKLDELKGNVTKRRRDGTKWLEAERSEDLKRESERPVRGKRAVFMRRNQSAPKSRLGQESECP